MSGRVVVSWTPAAKARVFTHYTERQLSGTANDAVIRSEHNLAISKNVALRIAFRAGLSDPGRDLGPSLSAARAVLNARPGNTILVDERLRHRRKAWARMAASRSKTVRVSTPRPRPVAKAGQALEPKPAPKVKVGIPRFAHSPDRQKARGPRPFEPAQQI